MENTELVTQPSLRAGLGAVAVGNHGVQLATMDDIFRFSKAIAMSQLCPKGFSETDVFVILCHGLEVGMSPMSALASTYVVNGRATIFGDMPLGLVRQSGLLEDYSQEYQGKPFDDDYKCVITTLRKGAKSPITTEYSVADAKIAKRWGEAGPWSTAPKRMLMFRARAFNLRDNFGDVLKGCSIAELDDNEPGFANAKPARVVEPNFGNQNEKPFQESEKIGAKISQMKAEVRNATQSNEEMRMSMTGANLPGDSPHLRGDGPLPGESDADLKKRARQDLEAAVENGKKSPHVSGDGPEPMRPSRSEVGPMRPSRSEVGPSKKTETASSTAAQPTPESSSPAEEPPVAPPTKPVAPPKPPRPPKEAPPDTKPTRYEKLVKKLAEEDINHDKFMLCMFDFGLLDPAIEREEISAGNVGLDKLDEKAIDLAAKNWNQVLEEIAKL